jgi:hypothetical protein
MRAIFSLEKFHSSTPLWATACTYEKDCFQPLYLLGTGTHRELTKSRMHPILRGTHLTFGILEYCAMRFSCSRSPCSRFSRSCSLFSRSRVRSCSRSHSCSRCSRSRALPLSSLASVNARLHVLHVLHYKQPRCYRHSTHK